jgi:hypothetical protein
LLVCNLKTTNIYIKTVKLVVIEDYTTIPSFNRFTIGSSNISNDNWRPYNSTSRRIQHSRRNIRRG